MSLSPTELVRAYRNKDIVGWAGYQNPSLVKEQFKLLGGNFKSFFIANQTRATAGRKMFLHQVVRKVLGADTKNYGQEIGDPFAAGTMVAMADGTEKAIENLVVGDKVLNHKNETASVSRVIKKQFTGRMITVRLRGWHRPLTATETHHGMLIPKQRKCGFDHESPERVKFGDMRVGDYMLTSYGLDANDITVIDVTDHLSTEAQGNNDTVTVGKYSIRRQIVVDEQFGRLMGLYLAEGGLGGDKQVTFSFNANETALIEETKKLLNDVFGVEAVTHKTGVPTCTHVAVNSPLLFQFLGSLVPGTLYSKRVPHFFFRSPRFVKKALLRGWFDGDGYKNFKKRQLIGYTSSDGLGDDMLRLMMSCRILSTGRRYKRRERASCGHTQVSAYSNEVHSLYSECPTVTRRAPNKLRRTPYGVVRKIESLEEEFVENRDVYCITTENEYTAVFNGVSQYQCVSFGAKNASEYLTCTEILMGGERQKFRSIFPPYYYGTGRVYVGGGRLGNGDGSLGSWMATAVMKYGTLFADEPDVPAYSGRVAKSWGDSSPNNDLDKFKATGVKYLVRSASLIKSWDDLVAAIVNGFPCTTASGIGYSMEASSDGFHRQTTSWAHQMMVFGVDDEYKNGEDPYALILNSWGDAHGRLKDFETGEELPVGILRVRRKDMEKHIREQETFAFSQFDGFPEQQLDKKLFDLIGND